MVNTELLKVVTPEKLIEMGFVEENDGSGDPRGIDYNIRNENFHLLVDPWCEVKLCRLNPDTDYITIHCESIFDLQCVVYWIAS
jgi:hypothetical protein